jgi:hypothetical protein
MRAGVNPGPVANEVRKSDPGSCEILKSGEDRGNPWEIRDSHRSFGEIQGSGTNSPMGPFFKREYWFEPIG